MGIELIRLSKAASYDGVTPYLAIRTGIIWFVYEKI
jgi:hypothetical protein